MPNFVLQPLVKNAVKHAVAPSMATVTITIRASSADGDLILRVSDDASAIAVPRASGTGLGLRNVAQRIEAIYGVASRIGSGRVEEGFAVTVRFPPALSRNTRAIGLAIVALS